MSFWSKIYIFKAHTDRRTGKYSPWIHVYYVKYVFCFDPRSNATKQTKARTESNKTQCIILGWAWNVMSKQQTLNFKCYSIRSMIQYPKLVNRLPDLTASIQCVTALIRSGVTYYPINKHSPRSCRLVGWASEASDILLLTDRKWNLKNKFWKKVWLRVTLPWQ